MLNKTKINENLRSKFLKDREEQEAGSGNDSRVLNYFDLDYGQQIEVLLVADEAGELFYEYSSHNAPRGTNVKGSNCSYTSSREPCCVCEYGWDIYTRTSDQDLSGKWRRKNHILGQVLPLNMPKGFSVPESEDGNLVKLFYMPWGIKELIVDSLINQTISDPTEHVLVIKKTKNQGGKPAYNKSYFKVEKVVLDPVYEEAYANGLIKPYNLKAELPAPTTSQDMETWLRAALEGSTTNRFWDKYLPEAKAQTADESGTPLPKLNTTTQDAPAAAVAPKGGSPSLMERLEAARAGKTV